MLDEILREINEEAKKGVITLRDEDGVFPVRMCFSFDSSQLEVPNLAIKDIEKFKKVVAEYAYCALEFYKLLPTRDNVKTVLTYAWSNITNLK